MSSIWSVIVLALAAVITAVWIGLLGFGLLHFIERVIQDLMVAGSLA
jgi:hypothetical protein